MGRIEEEGKGEGGGGGYVLISNAQTGGVRRKGYISAPLDLEMVVSKDVASPMKISQ